MTTYQQTCISCPATPRLASWSFTHPQYPVDQNVLVILHHIWGLCDHYPREVWRLCSHHHYTWWKTFVVLYIAIYAIPKVQSNASKKTCRLFVWTVRSPIGKPALKPHSNNTTPQHSVMTTFAPRLLGLLSYHKLLLIDQKTHVNHERPLLGLFFGETTLLWFPRLLKSRAAAPWTPRVNLFHSFNLALLIYCKIGLSKRVYYSWA